MGLLDIMNSDDARFGINLLAAASPSMQPMGFGERLGLAMRMNDEQRLRSQEEQMRKEQMRLLVQKANREQQQLAQQDAFMSKLGNLLGGGQQQSAPQPVPLPELGSAQGTGQYRLDVETPQAQANLKKQLDYLAKNDPQAHQQVIAALVKQGAIQPPMQQAQAPQTNWNDVAVLSAGGQLAGIHGASGLMELAKFNRPDWQQIDSGGQIQFVNKNGQQMPVIQKTMSPDAIASNQVAWANNGIAQQNADIARFNATKPAYHDGALVGPDGSITKTPMYAPPKNSPEANAQSSAKIVPLLAAADKLLGSATGSYAGAGADMAAGLVGISTKGAQSAAQLKALEGAIMMAQPRMEGPQSDKDAALYRQMAGQIGDSTIPVETRRAALDGIRRLHEAYSGGALTPQSTMSPGGWSATVVK